MSTTKDSRRKRKAAERQARFIRNLEVASHEAMAARMIDPSSERLLDEARQASARLDRGRHLCGIKD